MLDKPIYSFLSDRTWMMTLLFFDLCFWRYLTSGHYAKANFTVTLERGFDLSLHISAILIILAAYRIYRLVVYDEFVGRGTYVLSGVTLFFMTIQTALFFILASPMFIFGSPKWMYVKNILIAMTLLGTYYPLWFISRYILSEKYEEKNATTARNQVRNFRERFRQNQFTGEGLIL